MAIGRECSFDEQNTMLRLSRGDEGAFRDVYDRYWRHVYRAAKRYLQSDDLAQDIVQEVFAALWHKKETFTTIRNLESYLVSVAHYHTFRLLRKWAAENKNNQEYAYDFAGSVDDSDHLIRYNEYEMLLSEAVNLLPPQQKQVFQLARVEGLTHEAIASRLNLSQGTVKNHMVRALQSIRKYLAPHVSLYFLFLLD